MEMLGCLRYESEDVRVRVSPSPAGAGAPPHRHRSWPPFCVSAQVNMYTVDASRRATLHGCKWSLGLVDRRVSLILPCASYASTPARLRAESATVSTWPRTLLPVMHFQHMLTTTRAWGLRQYLPST